MWYIAAIVSALLATVAWIGFRINPRPIAYHPTKSCDLGSIPIPTGLPAPVERFARAIFGDSIPIIETLWVRGNAGLVLGKIRFPMRFQFFYECGKSYYHLIEMAWFGIPIVTAHELFKDGIARLALPGSNINNDPNTNAAANQGLWGEAMGLPSILFTDSRVRWEAIDDNSARLIIPGASEEEHFTLYFDSQTGLLSRFTAQRFQNAGDVSRRRWTNLLTGWNNNFASERNAMGCSETLG